MKYHEALKTRQPRAGPREHTDRLKRNRILFMGAGVLAVVGALFPCVDLRAPPPEEVNPESATWAELFSVPGIGEKTACTIYERRIMEVVCNGDGAAEPERSSKTR